MNKKINSLFNSLPFQGKEATKGFTLVELIVVITILAILGTIAFISLQGYSASSRDSVRISDVSNMKTSLELFFLNAGKYPLPDTYETVSYNSEDLWYQGTFGETVVSQLSRNMSEIPTDSLSDKKYIYSVANNKNEFQILNLLEGDLVINTATQTNAANTIRIPKLDGQYNGVFIKTATHIVPTPSIITSENITGGLTLDVDNIKSQIITNGKNIPNILNINSATGQLTGLVLSVYNGIINKDSLDTDKILVMQKIQTAYTGSELANNDIYAYILSKTTTEDLVALVDTVVLNSNTVVPTTTTKYSCIGTVPTSNVTKINDTGLTLDTTWQTTTSGDNCYYECSGGYTGTNCDVLNPYASCTGVNIPVPFSATTTYTGCDIADIIVCSGNGIGITIAGCNVGATAGSEYALCTNLASCTTARVGGYFQFGRNLSYENGTWTNGTVGIGYDWESTGWVDGIDDGSANYWGVYEVDKTTTTYSNPLGLTNIGLMQGPCDATYHIPTNKEWNDLITAGDWLNSSGNKGDNMKASLNMPIAGRRDINASMNNQGTNGFYRSSSPNGSNGYYMALTSTLINKSATGNRAYGYSVRCFKN